MIKIEHLKKQYPNVTPLKDVSVEIHDGDGLRTTVFFKGCPLNCIWCHNPESIQFAPQTAFFKSKCIFCCLSSKQE